jgi:hypothetical protein
MISTSSKSKASFSSLYGKRVNSPGLKDFYVLEFQHYLIGNN